ncbi:MAG: hypothetical protein AAFX00_07235 [Pseudomonadota bacterium]
MFGTIDTTISSVLMVVGGLVMFVGLFLMFRPSAHGAKFELFGLKFESSSAGILVFLVGTGLLVNPIYMDRVASQDAETIADDGTLQTRSDGAVVATVPEGAMGGQPVDLTVGRALFLEGAEIEPNNTLAGANVVAVGSSISGEVTLGDDDFFTFFLPDGFEGEVAINVDGHTSMKVFDDLGTQIYTDRTGGGPSFREAARAGQYTVKVENWSLVNSDPKSYQVNVAARPSR